MSSSFHLSVSRVSFVSFPAHHSCSSQLRLLFTPHCVPLSYLSLVFLFRFTSLFLPCPPVLFLVYRSIPFGLRFVAFPLLCAILTFFVFVRLFLVHFIPLWLISPVPFLVYCSISSVVPRFPFPYSLSSFLVSLHCFMFIPSTVSRISQHLLAGFSLLCAFPIFLSFRFMCMRCCTHVCSLLCCSMFKAGNVNRFSLTDS